MKPTDSAAEPKLWTEQMIVSDPDKGGGHGWAFVLASAWQQEREARAEAEKALRNADKHVESMEKDRDEWKNVADGLHQSLQMSAERERKLVECANRAAIWADQIWQRDAIRDELAAILSDHAAPVGQPKDGPTKNQIT